MYFILKFIQKKGTEVRVWETDIPSNYKISLKLSCLSCSDSISSSVWLKIFFNKVVFISRQC